MPKLVKEITEGVGYSYSSENGQVAASQPRVFRVILNDPNELINIEDVCGVRIGDELRPGAGIYCTSFDARYEGQSRLVLLCTFQFRTTPDANSSSGGSDPKSQPPNVRPANWTTSTSLVEVPRTVWARRIDALGWAAEKPAINPAGDMYDGVTAMDAVVTISIEQWEANDPTRHLLHAGSVNIEDINLGSLAMTPGTVMFRGVSSQPAVEQWGGLTYRGWRCVYEFAYRRNRTKITIGDGLVADGQPVDIGWDIAVPVSGYNCRAFAPAGAAANEDIWGQPLKHKNGKVESPRALPDGVDPGDRVRAMVKVFEYEDGGVSQAPSASPIALKENGRPLKTHDSSGNLINPPIVYAYRTQPAINLTTTLGLRFF